MIDPQIDITLDGSDTLIHPSIGEYYHSTRGAVGEAMHVYIKHGLEYARKGELNILEIGFGSGLNAFLTLKNAAEARVNYYAVELYPISLEVASKLNYTLDSEFVSLHNAPWEHRTEIADNFSLTKWEQDLLKINFGELSFDLVYFDAFSPDAQMELWSESVFRKIADTMPMGAVLVTYCAKGVVKQALRAAGFQLKRLEGALGKHHMLRATKI